MSEFLKWATNVEIHMCGTTSNWEHVFFSERIAYSGSFIEIDTPEEIKAAILKEGGIEIVAYLDCHFYCGKQKGEYSWGFTPKPERVRLGFAGATLDELMSRVLKWLEDNTDHEMPSAPVPYGADKLPKIPLITRTKRVPHWKDNKDD